jgi:4-hydroxy-2-oxoheptanedioate aldolase
MRAGDGTEATDDEFEATLQCIVDIGKRTGTPTGMHCMDPQTALRRADQGMQFIAVGSELRMMSLMAQEIVRAVNPESADKDLARY